jgi:hypothetical protein
MFLAVAAITSTVFLLKRDGGGPSKQPTTKAEVRLVLGSPEKVEVLRRAECWYYGPQAEFTEAKVCFGERGRLAWYAWGNRQPPQGTTPPPPLFP